MPGVMRRQRQWADLIEPRALEGRWEGHVFGIACLLTIALIAVGDVQTGVHVTVGSFMYVPLIGAAWLLSDRWVVGLSLAAVVSRVVAVELHGVQPLTAVVQVSVIPFVAVVGRTAAVSVRAAREQVSREALTSRISSIASSAASLSEILDGILGLVAREGLRGGTIALIDERNRLYIAAAEGTVDPEVMALRLPVGEGVMGRAASELEPVLVEDLWSNVAPDSPTRGVGTNSTIRSVVAVPLIAAGRAIGVLECDSDEPGRFDASDVVFLQQVAVAVTGAVQRAGALQLADELLQRRVRELTILLDAARGVAGSLDLPVLIRTVCRSAADIAVGPAAVGRRSSVVRVEAAHGTVIGEYDERGKTIVGMTFGLEEHPAVERAARTGEPTYARGDEFSADLQRRLRAIEVAVTAAAPIRVSGAVWGVLIVSTEVDYDFSESDLRLLQAIADLAGLAIANAELLRLERRRSEQLREHGERMAALDHAKSEFLRLASHELRGPLGVVRGYISLLADGSLGELPSSVERVMPILANKIAEMNLLIDQMLETARLEDSRLQLTLEEVDLRGIVQSAVASLRGRASAQHQLEVAVPPVPVLVRADRGRVLTIISNLVDNAIKYSPEGGAVRCELVATGDQAHVSVSDEGLGIAASDMDRLFTRFGRLVTSENSHIAGTGLGLYLSRELARMHHGDITVSSAPGSGSRFTLELPLASVASSAASA